MLDDVFDQHCKEAQEKIERILEAFKDTERDPNYDFGQEFDDLMDSIVDDPDIKKPTTFIRGDQLVQLLQLCYDLNCGIADGFVNKIKLLEKYRMAYGKLKEKEKKTAKKFAIEKAEEYETLN